MLADGRQADIAVSAGRIIGLGATGSLRSVATTTIDLVGRLAVPGFVEGHIHLDTSFYGDTWRPHKPCTNGFDVHERVAFQAQNLSETAPMGRRARDQLDLCIGSGTTHVRSHVMIDNIVGLSHLETILAVRDEYCDLVDIQLVAFPQNGILINSGTAELLDAAIGMGCNLIGGLDPATFDHDIERHLDVVFGIAERHGVDVDIHLHDRGTLGLFEIEQIAARTHALGMAGHVTVSHAYALGEISSDLQQKIAATLARSGVAIMTNAPVSYAFPPVAILREAGVTVFGGSDNIRDSWWPYGDGDMLRRANIIGYRSGFFEDRELEAAFDVVTHSGARARRLEGYGVAVGAKADFVVFESQHIPEAVVAVGRGYNAAK